MAEYISSTVMFTCKQTKMTNFKPKKQQPGNI